MELQGSLQMTAGSITLDGYLLLLFAIMLCTGFMGGVANYFLSERVPGFALKDLLRHIVLGVVAALTVPLFLNMISSDLLAMARTRPIDLFVFAGFCLIFVLASRRLVDTLAPRLRPPLG
ncbi:YEATS-associated helix-containing protein [Thiobacter aerophilum]|uniref:YEATS-associated helix-containing protein n=1 Tax=Thiobacter aerophilum TaxID=3121275 RepID=A0ABV0EF22_9BURK